MPEGVLLEDLLASRRGLGAEYRFRPGTLDVRPNRHGIRGVFLLEATTAGAEIISVPVTNGSMTPLRSYEEAADLLATLGPARFNVSQEFAIAAAIYLRSIDPDRASTDILITEPDLAAAYAGTPMSSYDSLARVQLLSSNNREALEYAAELDRQIEQLDVNPALFRGVLGYISSRAWKGVGVIPVLDWFNASYADGANCTFQTRDGRYRYVAIRDIAAGEELLWNYNNANAVTTWLNYGYVDPERPTLAFMEIRLESSQQAALDAFARRKLNLVPGAGASHTKVDACMFQRELLTPGQATSDSQAHRTLAACMKSFAHARAWFRMLVLSSGETSSAPVTHASIHADELPFAPAVEARVLATMRTALSTGLEALRTRVGAFSRTSVGRDIDMSPYVLMAEDAHRRWNEALALAERMCETGDATLPATAMEAQPASLVASMGKCYARALG